MKKIIIILLLISYLLPAKAIDSYFVGNVVFKSKNGADTFRVYPLNGKIYLIADNPININKPVTFQDTIVADSLILTDGTVISAYTLSRLGGVYLNDSNLLKTVARTWNASVAKTITATDTTRWGEGGDADTTKTPELGHYSTQYDDWLLQQSIAAKVSLSDSSIIFLKPWKIRDLAVYKTDSNTWYYKPWKILNLLASYLTNSAYQTDTTVTSVKIATYTGYRADSANNSKNGSMTKWDHAKLLTSVQPVGALTSNAVIIGNGTNKAAASTTTGILKATSGVLSAAVAETDYCHPYYWTRVNSSLNRIGNADVAQQSLTVYATLGANNAATEWAAIGAELAGSYNANIEAIGHNNSYAGNPTTKGLCGINYKTNTADAGFYIRYSNGSKYIMWKSGSQYMTLNNYLYHQATLGSDADNDKRWSASSTYRQKWGWRTGGNYVDDVGITNAGVLELPTAGYITINSAKQNAGHLDTAYSALSIVPYWKYLNGLADKASLTGATFTGAVTTTKINNDSIEVKKIYFNHKDSVSGSGSYNLNLAGHNLFTFTPTNTTTLSYINAAIGTYLIVIHNGATGYATTLAANKFKHKSGIAIASGNSKMTLLSCYYNGWTMIVTSIDDLITSP